MKNKVEVWLLIEVKDLKEKMIQDRSRYDSAREIIVKTIFMTIFERVSARLSSLHKVCKILYLVV